MKLNFRSTHYSPRLIYAVDFLLGQILGFDIIYGEAALGSDEGLMVIDYGKERPTFAKFFIPAHPFLEEKTLSIPEIQVQRENGKVAFFHVPSIERSDLPFDIFALTFYLLSRIEEYGPTTGRDDHQRFLAKKSIAHQHRFLQQPLIDQWAWELYGLLKKEYPNCPDRSPSYTFLPTIDVDFAWAYLHKGPGKATGTFLKSLLTLQWRRLAKQVKVNLGLQKDPYQTFDLLIELYQKYHVKPLFFMLLAAYGGFDKSNPPDNVAFQKLIRKLAKKATIGIHPSYASNNDNTLLVQEVKNLEEILLDKVTISRQHFLKLALPITYRNLLEAGIETDYTMGYAEELGFRASTAYSFYWYDIEKEEQTKLKVVPFAVMDVTLKNYLKLSPKEGLLACAKIIEQTRKTGGAFCLLWHNSSFSEEMGWEDWAGVYEKIVALATESKQKT